jgi:hypothetical protein
MEERHWHVSIPELFQLWVEGLHVDEIAKRLQTTPAMIYKLKALHRLPKRQRVCHRDAEDPTPEQIEERKAEIRAKHLERMRKEPVEATTSRMSKRKRRAGTACTGL